MISHAQALEIVRRRAACAVGEERLPLPDALGRFLAAPLFAERAHPAFDNAAVDGYAAARADIRAAAGAPMPIRGRVAAGEHAAPLATGAACRIFTGAPIPAGADIIIMDEDITERGEDSDPPWLAIPAAAAEDSDNIRRRGEDVAEGDTVIEAGRRLRPQDLAAAASLGVESLACRRLVRVAVFSTGEELRAPSSETASDNAVSDSNRTLLFALLRRLPARTHDGGILPDDAATIAEALTAAAKTHDMVLTSGGVGYGEEDHLLSVFSKQGEILFRRVAIKPGRPVSLALLPGGGGEGCPVLALPGNPVAAMVCFLLYARPLLARLGGGSDDALHPQRFRLPAAFAMKKKLGRREFQRGILCAGEDGAPAVTRFTQQGSGILRSLRCADGLIELDEEIAQVAPGDAVWFLPFTGMGIDA